MLGKTQLETYVTLRPQVETRKYVPIDQHGCFFSGKPQLYGRSIPFFFSTGKGRLKRI